MTTPEHFDALIVGAGPIGLACAISARRYGFRPLVIDAGCLANSIDRYPIGMTFFTTPERLEIGGHPLVCSGAKATREEGLKYYRGVARTEGLEVRTYTRLAGAERRDGRVVCDLATRRGSVTVTCDRLVLATGYFDHPNRLGVLGEDLPHVSHYFDEAHRSWGLDVVVVGGKNSAVEAALQLFRAGARVTLVYRGTEFPGSVKYWLRPDIENRIAAGEIQARLGATISGISREAVTIDRSGGGTERIPADRVYALIGFHPDFDLFHRIGIEFDETSGRPVLNAATLETSVPGVHVAGSVIGGYRISEIFIENGRFDGEKIFGDPSARQQAEAGYAGIFRPSGE
ncbi:MAG: YpdA family putative bacillithiol disulfide reductase [Gemmatimonadales bacterium]